MPRANRYAATNSGVQRFKCSSSAKPRFKGSTVQASGTSGFRASSGNHPDRRRRHQSFWKFRLTSVEFPLEANCGKLAGDVSIPSSVKRLQEFVMIDPDR